MLCFSVGVWRLLPFYRTHFMVWRASYLPQNLDIPRQIAKLPQRQAPDHAFDFIDAAHLGGGFSDFVDFYFSVNLYQHSRFLLFAFLFRMFTGLFRKNIKLIRRVSVAKLPPHGSVLGLITAYHEFIEKYSVT